MTEKPESYQPQENPEEMSGKEGFNELSALFDEAEKIFEAGGREPAKKCLPDIYNKLMELNKWDRTELSPMTWNKDGDLTEEEFNELDLRRKKLSNAIGIMTADGTVRHNLNDI